MKHRAHPTHVAALLALVAAWPAWSAADRPTTATAAAQSWASWRGPLGTGEAPGAEPPTVWSETKNVRWKVEIPGRGHASPIVWRDRVFVLTAIEGERPPVETPQGERPRGIQPLGEVRFVVLALDRATGEVVWERTARSTVPHEGTHRTATWASASAVTDGEVLIASFGSNGIYAYRLDGEPMWSVDLGDMRVRNAFGEGASPVIHGDRVIVNWDHEDDSFLVALDRATGAERWRVARDEPTSWSTPVVLEKGGVTQVVVSATNAVRAYDLADGRELWSVGGMTLNTVPTPFYGDGVLYAMSGFRGNALLAIRPPGGGEEGGEPEVLWSHDRDTSYVPSALLYEGALWFLKSNGAILSSLDAASGGVLFGPERLPGLDGVYASPVGAAGRVYIVGQSGAALVLAAGPELEILATNELDDGFDASPAVVDGQIFLRGRSYLYCLEAGAASDEPSAGSG